MKKKFTEEQIIKAITRMKNGTPAKVLGRELRSPLDAVLAVRDAKGKNLANNDDQGGLDSIRSQYKLPAEFPAEVEAEAKLPEQQQFVADEGHTPAARARRGSR